MALYTGTATNYVDLLDKIVEAATDTGNDWEIVEDERATVGKKWIILKGVGDDDNQNILVGLGLYANVVADAYGLFLQGFTGYQAGNSFNNQIGAIPNITPDFIPHIPLWNSPMDYWIVVNKRRIMFVAKVSTLYVSGYLGYILPYFSSGQFPYPLCIGGTSRSAIRYDSIGTNNTHFVIPYSATLRLRNISGNWLALALPSDSSYLNKAGTYPYAENASGNNGTMYLTTTPNTGGDVFPIQPVLVFQATSANNNKGNIFGELEGVYNIGGLVNAVENVVKISGEDYLVVQNVYRTTTGDFWAMKLV